MIECMPICHNIIREQVFLMFLRIMKVDSEQRDALFNLPLVLTCMCSLPFTPFSTSPSISSLWVPCPYGKVTLQRHLQKHSFPFGKRKWRFIWNQRAKFKFWIFYFFQAENCILMYFFWLRIETEMLKYENCLYKLLIKTVPLSSPKTKSKKGKKYTKRNLPYLLLRDHNNALFYLSLSSF